MHRRTVGIEDYQMKRSDRAALGCGRPLQQEHTMQNKHQARADVPPTSRRAATGFLLLLAVLLLAAPQQADAQRARTLVSNIRGGGTSGASIDRAQRFTTGPGLNSGGYTLSSIEIFTGDHYSNAASVAVWTVDSDGYPAEAHATLTPPDSFAKETLVFTNPSNPTLAATTTYTVLIQSPKNSDGKRETLDLGTTTSGAENAGGADGWSIADKGSSRFGAGSGSWNHYDSDAVFRIGVNGLLVGAANRAPMATTATVTTTEEVSHTFTVANFNFADPDLDFLASVKIVAPPAPAKGRLTLDDMQVTANQVVTKADLGANKLRFTPAMNGFGNPYTTFTFKVSDGEAESAEAYTMTVNVTGTNDPATGAPTISGTLRVGATLTAVTTGIMDVDGLSSPDYMYQWILVSVVGGVVMEEDLFVNMEAVTSATYVLRENFLGARFKVRVTFTDNLKNTERRTSAATEPVTGRANRPATGAPTISGTAEVGEELTAETTGIADGDGLPSIFAYQWVRVDGTETDITDADAATYTLVDADAGTRLKVKVSFGDNQGNQETRTSAAFPTSGTIGDPNGVTNTAPTASNAMVTTNEDTPRTFTAAEFNFADADTGDTLASVTVVTLQAAGKLELSGTQVIIGQSVPAANIGTLVFTPAANANGSPYTTFTFKVSDGEAESAVAYTMTVNVTAVNDPATGAPTISGTATVGQVLTATTTTDIADVDGLTSPTYTYQWVRVDADGVSNETDITDENAATYTLVAADAGKKIKVKVSFSDNQGNQETRTSAAFPPSGTIVDPNSDNTAPTASNAMVTTNEDTPHTFTATEFNFADADTGDTLASVTVVTLQAAGKLELNGTQVTMGQSVPAANIGTLVFTPAANANGSPYTTFTFKVSDGEDESAVATMTVNVTAVNDPATGVPTISGTATVGQVLTATTTDIADVDGLTSPTYTYQWVRVDADGVSNETDITDENAVTYTLVDADAGKKIKVKVSFSDNQGNPETRTSAAYPPSGTVAVLAPALVSNAGQANTDLTAPDDRAQRFTTGDNSGGYTLSSIEIVSTDNESDDASVAVWTVDSDGNPNVVHATLTPPGSFAQGTLVFTDPSNTTLEASTTYTVLIQSPGEDQLTLGGTASPAEDTGGEEDWEIADGFDTDSGSAWSTSSGKVLRLTVKGTPVITTPLVIITRPRPILPPTGGRGGGGGSITQDDHGNTPGQATPVGLTPARTASTPGQLNTATDVDYFTVAIPSAGVLVVETSGSTATVGTVWQNGEELAMAADGGAGRNFRLSARVAPGPVVIAVAGNGQQTGSYRLQVTLLLGFLENPGANSFQSGIGVISGWVCEGEEVEIEIETEIEIERGAVVRQAAGYGTARADTAGVCGDTDNGFGLLFNWNLLGDGDHEVAAFVDGVELDRATVTVTTLGAEFVQEVEGTCEGADFPEMGETVTLVWQQSKQNFVIAEGSVPRGPIRTGTAGVGYLENPGPNSFQSGIGVISGWVCEAEAVELEIGAAGRQAAAYGTERLDTAGVCGDTDNGFGLLFNWNLLGEGEHAVVAYADAQELGRATVRVTTLGAEFVRDVEGECMVEDFPDMGRTVTLEWQQNSQNFVITDVE